jgi:hypothetical protein
MTKSLTEKMKGRGFKSLVVGYLAKRMKKAKA